VVLFKEYSPIMNTSLLYYVFILACSLTACSNQNATKNDELISSLDSFRMEESDSFIKLGIKYLYNDAEIIDISTEPQTSKEFDYAEAVFTEKDVTIKVAGVSTTYQIKNSSYKKMVGGTYKRADFILLGNGVECKAEFWVGDNGIAQQGFIIYHPVDAVAKYYQDNDNPLSKYLPEPHLYFQLIE